MSNLDECAPEEEPYAYRNASYRHRMLVITAGSLMHFAQALVLFVVLASVIGAENQQGDWEVETVVDLDGETTPAVELGLEPGDKIVSVDGQDAALFSDLQDYIAERPGEVVEIEYVRSGETSAATVELSSVEREDGQTVGILGVNPVFERERQSPLVGVGAFGEAMWVSARGLIGFPVALVQSIPLIFQPAEPVAIDSDEAQQRPVSLVGVVNIAGNDGVSWVTILTILAFINVFVGQFNLVPLLPLDGGHAAIATYERIRSRSGRRYRADMAKAIPIFYGTVAFLAITFFTTLWLDVFRPIGG